MEVTLLQAWPGICDWPFGSFCLSLCPLLSTDPSSWDHDLTGFSRLAEKLSYVLKMHLQQDKKLGISHPTETALN